MKSIDVSQLSYPSMKEVAGDMSQRAQNGEKPLIIFHLLYSKFALGTSKKLDISTQV